MPQLAQRDAWPALPLEDWRQTYQTLHLWTQIVGKVRLALTPWLNHSWHTTLYVTSRGLSTGPMSGGRRSLEIELDLIGGALRIRTDGPVMALPLEFASIADFHAALLSALKAVGAPVRIHGAPSELPEATPFHEDTASRVYEAAKARRFFLVLAGVDRVFRIFRTSFLGKSSPVHFFWGGFDLAVTRFSGRSAPQHPGGVPHLPDVVTREAYSHEVSSAGFWPGGPGCEEAAFYSYAYPEPPGFRDAPVRPPAARYDAGLGEYLLPYEAVRTASDPEAILLDFLRSTYEAAANAAGWDRAALECPLGEPRRPRPI
jgi:hypothetical protein